MVYITNANFKKIICTTNIANLNLQGEVYKIPIRFISRYETNQLLAIKELLQDPERFFNEIYVPYKNKDTFTYVYEGVNGCLF